MSKRRIQVEIDTDLYERTRQVLGTHDVEATIHAALREIVRRDARRREIDALSEMKGMDLDQPDVIEGMWRQ